MSEKTYTKNDLFSSKNRSEILRNNSVTLYNKRDGSIYHAVQGLGENEVLVINGGLIPSGYISSFSDHELNSRVFMRHGRDVKFRRSEGKRASLQTGYSPLDLMAEAFDDVNSSDRQGYSYKSQKDGSIVQIPLTECINGAKLFTYGTKGMGALEVSFLTDEIVSPRVLTEGSDAIVKVPSLEKNVGRYKFLLESIPVIDNVNKHVIWQNLTSNHSCDDKMRKKLSHNYLGLNEGSRKVVFDLHDVAGYMGVANHYAEKGNLIPQEMSPFAVPSQEMMDFSKKFDSKVLISMDGQTYVPTSADKEISLWDMVKEVGYNNSFSTDGKIPEYNM